VPAARKIFNRSTLSRLDTRPFVEAQPIWAELFTGTPWYENGCSSYGEPVDSLNRLEVFSEALLSQPVTLLKNQATTVCVNVPLLLPLERTWIADGSLPILSTFSPKDVGQFFSNQQRPRPYASLAAAMKDRYESAAQLISCEIERLDATTRILREREWHEAIVRLSAFDQLQHLFGVNALFDDQLVVHENITHLLAALDNMLHAASEAGCDVACISAHSHAGCRARFNVNLLLRDHDYLEVSSSVDSSNSRSQALALIAGAPPSAVSLGATGGKLSPQTKAACPAGCGVYINTSSSFKNGQVSDAAAAVLSKELQSLLEEKLYYYFGGRGSVHAKRSTAKTKHPTPEFVLYVPDVEFYDGSEAILDNFNKPLVCHRDEGFLAIDSIASDSETLTTVEANRRLRAIGFGGAIDGCR
jgi:hypothetical protein